MIPHLWPLFPRRTSPWIRLECIGLCLCRSVTIQPSFLYPLHSISQLSTRPFIHYSVSSQLKEWRRRLKKEGGKLLSEIKSSACRCLASVVCGWTWIRRWHLLSLSTSLYSIATIFRTCTFKLCDILFNFLSPYHHFPNVNNTSTPYMTTFWHFLG